MGLVDTLNTIQSNLFY